MAPPAVLVVDASDATGSTGLQAAFAALSAATVRPAGVVTSVTARGARQPGPPLEVPSALVREQLRAALAGALPGAVVIGWLPSLPVLRAVARTVRELGVPLVVEPVLTAGDGSPLVGTAVVQALGRELLPAADLVVATVDDAARLAGRSSPGEETEAKAAARAIQGFGPRAVLVIGGVSASGRLGERLLDGREWVRFEPGGSPVAGPSGAGIGIAASAAAWLALGETLPDAVDRAVRASRLAAAEVPAGG